MITCSISRECNLFTLISILIQTLTLYDECSENSQLYLPHPLSLHASFQLQLDSVPSSPAGASLCLHSHYRLLSAFILSDFVRSSPGTEMLNWQSGTATESATWLYTSFINRPVNKDEKDTEEN